jgi:hypothetical protein
LQKLDPIVKDFSDKSFQSYICFPYVGCQNSSGNSWTIEIFAAQELFCFKYPFQVPKSFLASTQKNDLRLKFRFIRALAVPERKKVFNIDDFFDIINVPNKHLIKIKKNIIQLLNELVINRIIKNKVEIILKSGKKKTDKKHCLLLSYLSPLFVQNKRYYKGFIGLELITSSEYWVCFV